MVKLKAATLLRDLFRRKNGAMAVEFALLLPLLIAFYAMVFELGRGWLAKQKLEVTVEAAARFAARHPEFENRVRVGLPIIVQEIARPLTIEDLDLSLYSVVIEKTIPTLVFPRYDFFGSETTVDWESYVKGGLFAETEPVIVVTGAYSYTPLYFGSFTGPITFRHAVALNPFFSRSYKYQAGNSDWSHFNMR